MNDEVDITACFLRYAASRDLELYRRTGERYLVLRTFWGYRRAGLPVPEQILKIIDTWAAEPATRGTARAIRAAERNLDVVEQAHIRQHELGQPADAAARAVAVDAGLQFTNVKRIKSLWYAPAKRRVEGTESAVDLQAAWRRVAVTQDDDMT